MARFEDGIEVLIGGKAGEGLNRAGQIIAEILAGLGYNIYMNFDHPSLIKGGHNFSLVRATSGPAGGMKKEPDVVIALDKGTIEMHADRISPETIVIFNSDKMKGAEGVAIPADSIVSEEGGIPIMANSCLIGAFCRCIGLGREYVEEVLAKEFPVKTAANVAVAKKGYDAAVEIAVLSRRDDAVKKVISGSEATALGLCYGGIEGYIAYPMSPSSGILHFLASVKEEFGLKVYQPEGEIAAILMAEGMACCGCRTAVGTSGGGFCLMNEGLSFSGMAEVPLVIVNAQRQGPSTGSPTYNAQSDLPFVIYAGHGEFPRIVVSPADAVEAFIWSAKAAGLAWKYQVPVIILTDVTLNDSLYSFDTSKVENLSCDYPVKTPGENEPYLRYKNTGDGISPFAGISSVRWPVKFNGKAHLESGISTDLPDGLENMAAKRVLKAGAIEKEVPAGDSVVVTGDTVSGTAVVSWGSNGPLCNEVCTALGLRPVRPVLLHPFPKEFFAGALSGCDKVIVVEDNSTGQLASLMEANGFTADHRILNNSGRQFTTDALSARITEVI